MRRREGDIRQRGFTLIEVLIVIAIAAILMGIATYGFKVMQQKAAVEKDVSTIYSTLVSVRLQALYTKTPRTVTLSGRQFNIYSSDVITPTPISSVTLVYPAVMGPTAANRVEFDASGIMQKSERSICVDTTGTLGDNQGNTDSVDVMTAKIYMGKRRSGGSCAPENIDQK